MKSIEVSIIQHTETLTVKEEIARTLQVKHLEQVAGKIKQAGIRTQITGGTIIVIRHGHGLPLIIGQLLRKTAEEHLL